jgi:hypothetical protein
MRPVPSNGATTGDDTRAIHGSVEGPEIPDGEFDGTANVIFFAHVHPGKPRPGTKFSLEGIAV